MGPTVVLLYSSIFQQIPFLTHFSPNCTNIFLTYFIFLRCGDSRVLEFCSKCQDFEYLLCFLSHQRRSHFVRLLKQWPQLPEVSALPTLRGFTAKKGGYFLYVFVFCVFPLCFTPTCVLCLLFLIKTDAPIFVRYALFSDWMSIFFAWKFLF